MAIARTLDLSCFVGDDLKHIFAIVGFNLTGVTCTFKIARNPNSAPLLTATTTVLQVTNDDGVPTSLVQAFAPRATVSGLLTALGAAPLGADLPLYYEFGVASLPGDFGAAADTTLLFGAHILKGSVDG
ncbi:hypothetical protein [uncultured Sphingomonas sp.]|uniref:hypothetical protein n=1 Tax=uncultured Sphingomonas sp. TaxID=158754 RepID=UPI0026002952|nr:hypothetical protein [uncultured Sphingomonas sp.]